LKELLNLYSITFFGLLLTLSNSALFAQANTRASAALSSGWFSTFAEIPVFNKHSIGKIIPDTKTTTIPIQTEPDSLSSKRSIKPGYVIGFAAIGFLAGLFFGAETAQGEEISGAAFHIKPAIIGAAIGVGLGVAVSLLKPEKVKKKRE